MSKLFPPQQKGRRELQRAVFLDRDGVINKPVVREGKPFSPFRVEEFEIYPEAAEACKILKEAGFLLIVATNQPEVGRGNLKQSAVEAMHKKMCTALPIDALEVCYASGENPEENYFRKPSPGMLLKAAGSLGIDLKKSYIIGDRWRDIACGFAAGCRTVFIDHGYSEKLEKEPHFRVKNISEAAKKILQDEASLIKGE